MLQALFVLASLGSSQAAADDKPFMMAWTEGAPTMVYALGEKDRGWTLSIDVAFAFADMDSGDELFARMSPGKKWLQCSRETEHVHYSDLRDNTKDTQVAAFRCRLTSRQKKIGKMKVRFDYKSLARRKTFKKVGKLAFEVRKGERYYYASPDNMVGPVVFQYDPHSMRGSKLEQSQPRLWFRTRLKTAYKSAAPVDIRTVCKKDGQRVFDKAARAQSKSSVTEEYSLWEVKVWAQHHVKRGSEKWGSNSNRGDWAFGDHPGEYECELFVEGVTYRKWAFTVNQDGRIEDRCGPALGFDAAHGIFARNRALRDHRLQRSAPEKHYLWRRKIPKACDGLL